MMKKLILLLIIITSFTNVSYASFPIIDTLQIKQGALQTETVAQYHLRMQKMGFDIDDCRCDDCKIFKGINTPLKNGEVRQKKGNNRSLFVTLGIWLIVAIVIFLIWFLLWVARGLENFSNGPPVIN